MQKKWCKLTTFVEKIFNSKNNVIIWLGDENVEKKVRKKLPSSYNYYKEVKIKSDKIALDYNITDEFNKSRLYNLILNLCNQIVYNYTYVLTTADLYFIADYNINLIIVLDNFREDIIKQISLV